MATTVGHTTRPIMHYWSMVKDLDDSQKLELVTLLVNSVKPSVEKAQETNYEEHSVKPYTMEEVNAMLDAAEADIAAGRTTPHEEVMREWEEEIACEESAELRPYRPALCRPSNSLSKCHH